MSSVPKCARLESGFTLMELMVSISIFVIMTVLLIVKFGNFNQNTNITNLAYDIALTLRTAQTYGMSVQGQATGAGISPMFQYSYGVAFCALASGSCPGASDTFSDQQLVMFADTDPAATRGAYDNSDINISPYNIKHGA